jgi:AmpD protein
VTILNPLTGIVDEATFIASPNYNERPLHTNIDLLVIHNISLPSGEFENNHVQEFFCNTLDSDHPDLLDLKDMKVSAHFYIPRNGDLIQFVSVLSRAWHAGISQFEGKENCNDFSIGVELQGTDTLPYADAQYEQLVRLVKCLQAVYPKITSQRIVGHCHIAPTRKTDPGPAFLWQRLFNQLDLGS